MIISSKNKLTIYLILLFAVVILVTVYFVGSAKNLGNTSVLTLSNENVYLVYIPKEVASDISELKLSGDFDYTILNADPELIFYPSEDKMGSKVLTEEITSTTGVTNFSDKIVIAAVPISTYNSLSASENKVLARVLINAMKEKGTNITDTISTAAHSRQSLLEFADFLVAQSSSGQFSFELGEKVVNLSEQPIRIYIENQKYSNIKIKLKIIMPSSGTSIESPVINLNFGEWSYTFDGKLNGKNLPDGSYVLLCTDSNGNPIGLNKTFEIKSEYIEEISFEELNGIIKEPKLNIGLNSSVTENFGRVIVLTRPGYNNNELVVKIDDPKKIIQQHGVEYLYFFKKNCLDILTVRNKDELGIIEYFSSNSLKNSADLMSRRQDLIEKRFDKKVLASLVNLGCLNLKPMVLWAKVRAEQIELSSEKIINSKATLSGFLDDSSSIDIPISVQINQPGLILGVDSDNNALMLELAAQRGWGYKELQKFKFPQKMVLKEIPQAKFEIGGLVYMDKVTSVPIAATYSRTMVSFKDNYILRAVEFSSVTNNENSPDFSKSILTADLINLQPQINSAVDKNKMDPLIVETHPVTDDDLRIISTLLPENDLWFKIDDGVSSSPFPIFVKSPKSNSKTDSDKSEYSLILLTHPDTTVEIQKYQSFCYANNSIVESNNLFACYVFFGVVEGNSAVDKSVVDDYRKHFGVGLGDLLASGDTTTTHRVLLGRFYYSEPSQKEIQRLKIESCFEKILSSFDKPCQLIQTDINGFARIKFSQDQNEQNPYTLLKPISLKNMNFSIAFDVFNDQMRNNDFAVVHNNKEYILPPSFSVVDSEGKEIGVEYDKSILAIRFFGWASGTNDETKKVLMSQLEGIKKIISEDYNSSKFNYLLVAASPISVPAYFGKAVSSIIETDDKITTDDRITYPVEESFAGYVLDSKYYGSIELSENQRIALKVGRIPFDDYSSLYDYFATANYNQSGNNKEYYNVLFSDVGSNNYVFDEAYKIKSALKYGAFPLLVYDILYSQEALNLAGKLYADSYESIINSCLSKNANFVFPCAVMFMNVSNNTLINLFSEASFIVLNAHGSPDKIFTAPIVKAVDENSKIRIGSSEFHSANLPQMQQSPIIVAYSCSAARDFGVTAIKNGALIYFGAYDPNIYSNNNFKIFFGNLTSLSAAQNQILSRISNNNTSALETGIPLQAVFESDPTILYGDPSVLVPVFKTPLGLRLLIDDNLAKSSLEFSYFDINLFNPFFDCLYLTAADEDTLIATSPGSAEAYIYSRKYVGTDFKKFLEYLSEKDDYARAYSFFNQAYTQISDFSSFMVNGKKYFTYLSHDAPDPSIFSKFNVLIISEDKMSARICLNESFAKGNQVGPRKIIISGKDYFG